MIRDELKMEGCYAIEMLDCNDGHLIERLSLRNKLTAINREVRAKMLLGTYQGTVNDLKIRYFAFGIGTAPVTVNDTKLDREVFRKQTTQIVSPSSGIVRSIVSLGSLECNTTIREIGVFCGPGANDEPDSGILVSRVAVNIEKNSNITLNIIRTDTCTI